MSNDSEGDSGGNPSILTGRTGSTIPFRDKRGRFGGSGRIRSGGNQFFRGTLEKGLANFERKTSDRIVEAAQDLAEKIQAYAKENAPWEDRSGDAREGLGAAVEADKDTCAIYLSHSVEYGVWLEIRWGAKYAIIIPTIEQLGPEIYSQMSGMCGEIVYYVD